MRLLEPNEASKMVRFRLENQSFLKPWEPSRTEEYFDEAYWQRQLRQSLISFRQLQHIHFVILNEKQSEVIGVCNYTNIIRGSFDACYLGYALAADEQGKGTMDKALSLSLSYMFNELELHRVMAHYLPHNLRSGNLLMKHGFEKEGLAKRLHEIDGIWLDHVITSLINPASTR